MRTVREIPFEPLRFYVSSDTIGQPPYLVDLMSINCNGECACADFITRRRKLAKGGVTQGRRTRCKHIEAARSFFLDKILHETARRIKASAKGISPNAPHNMED